MGESVHWGTGCTGGQWGMGGWCPSPSPQPPGLCWGLAQAHPGQPATPWPCAGPRAPIAWLPFSNRSPQLRGCRLPTPTLPQGPVGALMPPSAAPTPCRTEVLTLGGPASPPRRFAPSRPQLTEELQVRARPALCHRRAHAAGGTGDSYPSDTLRPPPLEGCWPCLSTRSGDAGGVQG